MFITRGMPPADKVRICFSATATCKACQGVIEEEEEEDDDDVEDDDEDDDDAEDNDEDDNEDEIRR